MDGADFSHAVFHHRSNVVMQLDDHTLQRYFANRPCPACQYEGTPEALFPLIARSSTSMVLFTCARCHQRHIFLVKSSRSHRSGSITRSDVTAMQRFLSTFDGDFQSLFGASS